MNLLLAIKTLRFIPVFFLLCVFVAALFYPGGNIHDSSQEGYSFTHNFLSDLGGYESHSSEQNFLSNFFFNMSMFVFALVGIAFLWIPQLFREDTLNWYLSCLGSFFLFIGTLFFAGVGLTPYDLYTAVPSPQWQCSWASPARGAQQGRARRPPRTIPQSPGATRPKSQAATRTSHTVRLALCSWVGRRSVLLKITKLPKEAEGVQ